MRSNTVHVFQNIPAQINRRELLAELKRLGAQWVSHSDPITWTRKDAQGQEYFETEPAKIEVGLPEGADPAVFAAAIAAHAPEKTDAEERDKKENDDFERKLIRAVRQASPRLKEALREALT